MNKQAQILLTVFISLLAFVSANAQPNLITADSAGKVKLGMTVAQVRKAVAPMKVSRTSDGEGIALILVKRGNVNVMTLYAGEEDRDTKINENAAIEQIWVLDKTYKTAAGVHPGMLLASAEKKYGGVKSIAMSEIESREFAEFKAHPNGIDFRLYGRNGTAGSYTQGLTTTSSFNAGAFIFSINVTGRKTSITGGMSDGEIVYASSYTDLQSGCKTSGGEEGGHVSHFCPGPGNYQIHYFDAATVYQINAATNDREWEEALMMVGLDKLSAERNVEWRLANGEPFAVLVTQPDSDKVIVRGLKGFERIKFEETGNGAIGRARSILDTYHKDIVVPPIRIYATAESPKVTANATLARVSEKVKYVINARAGDRLTVKVEAKKWTGDEGPIMVGIVTMPDGSSDGGPGGTVFDSVLTQTGAYRILVYQNAAKSQTKGVELTVTVTLGSPTTQSLDWRISPGHLADDDFR